MTAAKQRLDRRMVVLGLVATRSQAESYIKLGQVTVEGKSVNKPGFMVNDNTSIKLQASEQYVSRAGLKLASVARALKLDFLNKTVLDVGSSTGGFTDYALQHGASKVIAVDVGTDQMHPKLAIDPRVELYEKMDIRDFENSTPTDIVVADVSFISLRGVLPAVAKLVQKDTAIVAMAKPQFEAAQSALKHKGVIKNDRIRRDILKDLEDWLGRNFVIVDKADSQVAGSKGNLERFYLLRKL